jgi:CRP/FNR family transcriptional regulator, cyclic AMP receptor protein
MAATGAANSGNYNGAWPPGTLLSDLSETGRRGLFGLGAKRQYSEPNRILIREGDRSSVVYLLLAGMVKVTGAIDTGEALLAVRVGGDIVGELAALDNRPRLATVTTAGPVIARVIGQGEFVGFLRVNPDVALAITREVSDKLRSATARRIEFAGYSAAVRLARVLLELSIRYGEQTPAGTVIRCPLTLTELATLAGTTEPTAQRALRQLRTAGVATKGYRETTIHNPAALREIAFPASARLSVTPPT